MAATSTTRKIRERGFRSVLADHELVTYAQRLEADRLKELAKREARFEVAIRHSSYIGNDVPPSLTLTVDGRIFAVIYKDGTSR